MFLISQLLTSSVRDTCFEFVPLLSQTSEGIYPSVFQMFTCLPCKSQFGGCNSASASRAL